MKESIVMMMYLQPLIASVSFAYPSASPFSLADPIK